MKPLSVLFDRTQFAATFAGVAGDDASIQDERESMLWLEGGVRIAGPPFAWGHGLMRHGGEEHAFVVSCLCLVNATALNIYATGRITGLTRTDQFEGCYLASGARSAGFEDGITTYLQNERGVQLQLIVTDAATATTLHVDTLSVSLNQRSANSAV